MNKAEARTVLRTVRLARGLSLDEVALATGISKAQLSRVECGLRRLSPAMRVRVARALELSPRDAMRVPELAP